MTRRFHFVLFNPVSHKRTHITVPAMTAQAASAGMNAAAREMGLVVIEAEEIAGVLA